MIHRQTVFFAMMALVGALWGGIPAALAHSGHDHGGSEPPPPPPPPVANPGPGVAVTGDVFELVLKADGDGATLLFLADLDSNHPVSGATVEMDAAGTTVPVQPAGSPGVYRAAWSIPEEPADLTISVSAGGRDDLLLASAVAKPAAVVAAKAASPSKLLPDGWKPWLTGGSAALAALFGAGMIARRRSVAGAVVMLLGLVAAGSAFAHGGEDHGAAGAATAQAAVVPGRAVTMAKESQFLLEVRTAKAEAREVADTVRLVGRVVPDPSGYARVQPAQQGRVVSLPEFPLPVPGQKVKRGDVLIVLEPNLTALERSEQRAALFRVETEIIQITRQIRRWERMGEAARQKDLDEARLDLTRLQKERVQIEDIALGRELLKAPIDGVVTDVHIVPGEVIGPETTAIEVVDPQRLRIEAVLYDLSLADAIVGGQASTKLLSGHVFGLELIGSGGRIDAQDQGLHLIFRVTDGARLLRLGMPVDVYAQTGAASMKVSVPRQAVADAGGRPMVFVKTAPESFEARPVRVGRTIGAWSEIEAGVTSGERVVIQGAAQLLATR